MTKELLETYSDYLISSFNYYDRMVELACLAKDTTGAGDAFAAAFLHKYLRNFGPAYALGFANAAAALSMVVYGAQTRLPTTCKG